MIVYRRLRTIVAGSLLIGVVAACGSAGDAGTRSDEESTTSSQADTSPIEPDLSVTAPVDVVPIIVDTDVSLDDVMAILYLLRRPDVDIRAITVSGTGVAHCDAGVSIVLGLIAVAQRDSVPVACGAEIPLEGTNSFPEPWRDGRDSMAASGVLPDGGSPAAESASAVIVAAVAASPTPPTAVLLGPHTNLAQALRDDPDLERMLAGIHIMGGAIDVPGNTLDNPDAEWNLWIDPVANAEVFATDLPLTIVPLDATGSVPLTEQLLGQLEANLATPEAEAALGLARTDPDATNGLFMWDQLAVVALVEPTVVSWVDLDVAVDPSTDPQQSGTLRVGSGRPARVAMSADRSAFEFEYLSTLVGHPVDIASGSDDVSTARSDYITRADAVCAATNAEFGAVYEEVLAGTQPDAEPTAEQFEELWNLLEPILLTQLESLGEIPPPPDDAAVLDELYRDYGAALDDISASVDAAVAGDETALARLTGQSNDDPFHDVDQQARNYGFAVCGASE